MDKHLFVAYEMGNPGMSPVTSNTFVFCGYAVLSRDVDIAVDAWTNIKTEVCGRVDVELKMSSVDSSYIANWTQPSSIFTK